MVTASLIRFSADYRRLDHHFIERCPGGRADQNVSPEFFGPPFPAIRVVDHPHAVAVRMFREIADFSMIGVGAVGV
jgi:hypothetical protein